MPLRQTHIFPVKALGFKPIRKSRENNSCLRISRRFRRGGQHGFGGVAPVVAARGVKRTRQKIQGLAQLGGIDMAGACTLEAHPLCHCADDGNFRVFLQRKQPILVFQQHRPGLRRLLCKVMVGVVITGGLFFQRFRSPEHQLQNPAGTGVNTALRQGAIAHRRGSLLLHVIAAAGHIQVAPSLESGDPVVHSAPVRHHQPRKAPLRAENIRQ